MKHSVKDRDQEPLLPFWALSKTDSFSFCSEMGNNMTSYHWIPALDPDTKPQTGPVGADSSCSSKPNYTSQRERRGATPDPSC